MDLGPFSNINPCGFKDLEVVDMKRLGIDRSMMEIMEELTDILILQIGYDGGAILRTL
jgi:lipoate-protein ligase B